MLLMCCLSWGLSAQQTHYCGIDHATGEAIKERLMKNRQRFSSAELLSFQNQRAITWVPVVITNVGNTSGVGYTADEKIYQFFCGLNEIYAQQNVQFFLRQPIRRLANNDLDTDCDLNAAKNFMSSNKVSGVVNLYVGRSVNNQTKSYYSRPYAFGTKGDFVFLLQTMISRAAVTEAHEIGHFFSLPHTFYGWEGRDVEMLYGGGSVPSSINGRQVEYEVRSGASSNCASAGDGFCDTRADYYSERTQCPVVPTVTDPRNAAIDPDETNLMSYYLDACVDSFTPQQTAAVKADIQARNWVTQTPTHTTDLSSATISPVQPLNNGNLGSITNATVRLDWADTPGAQWYEIEIYNSFAGITIDYTRPIYKGLITNGNSYYDLATAGLVANQSYYWRVRPLSSFSTCAQFSTEFKFFAVATPSSIATMPLHNQLSFTLTNNPITTSTASIKLVAAKDMDITINVLDFNGRNVTTSAVQAIGTGENTLNLPVQDLANGIYIVTVATKMGTLHQKMLIQH